jgi:hypothetical protein
MPTCDGPDSTEQAGRDVAMCFGNLSMFAAPSVENARDTSCFHPLLIRRVLGLKLDLIRSDTLQPNSSCNRFEATYLFALGIYIEKPVKTRGPNEA